LFVLLFISVVVVLILTVIGYITPETVLIIVEIILLAFGLFLVELSFRRLFMIFMVLLITSTILFMLGYGSGRSYLSEDYTPTITTPSGTPNVIHFKSDASISGRIVRSGDRGVLFYDPMSNRLDFILWDTISSIEATPLKATVGR
jgi:hypothetical protein